MDRILCYLQGGLGNQCFIYATARALALSAGAELILGIDYLAEDFIYKRKLSLESFNCVLNIAPKSCKAVRVAKLLRYKLLRDRFSRVGNLCIDKRPYKFGVLPKEWRGTLTLDGYWQSEKYFYDAREQLLKDFQLKDDAWIAHDPVAQRIMACENSVFLHVRSYKEVPGKGDGQCAKAMEDYYRKAIAYIIAHVENPTFFVFSDDIKLAREIIGQDSFIYVEPFRSSTSTSNFNSSSPTFPSGQIRDFTLMRLCKHGIVADSSFSWWAGWLGEQEHGGIRIRPDQRVMNDDFWPERWLAV